MRPVKPCGWEAEASGSARLHNPHSFAVRLAPKSSTPLLLYSLLRTAASPREIFFFGIVCADVRSGTPRTRRAELVLRAPGGDGRGIFVVSPCRDASDQTVVLVLSAAVLVLALVLDDTTVPESGFSCLREPAYWHWASMRGATIGRRIEYEHEYENEYRCAEYECMRSAQTYARVAYSRIMR